MKKWQIAFAALVCAVCLATSVNAASGDAASRSGQQYTPEQIEAAKKMFMENYGNMEQTRQELARKQAELNRELASPAPDRGRIETLSTEIGRLRGKMLAARAELRDNLAARELPQDYYGRGPAPAYGPCWNGYDGYDRGGWYHHGRGHGGYHGPRGGCWR